MSNHQRKKDSIKKHNALYIERQAYAEDRIRDPEKYRRKRGGRTSSRMAAIIGASLVMSAPRGFN